MSLQVLSNTSLKIVFVSPSVSRKFTGVYEVEKNIARELTKLGLNIEIHGMVDEFTEKDLTNWLPIKPFVYKPLGPSKVGFNISFLRGLNNSNADVGHIHSIWSYTSFALYKWAKINNKPYLFTVNAYLFESALKQSKIKKKIALGLGLFKVIQNASCIQVNTLNEYHAVRKLGFKNPICLISNGVELEISKSNNLAPWETNINTQGKNILLFLSRIHTQKGIELLLNSWNNLDKKLILKDWHLVVVGFNRNLTNYERKIINFVKDNQLDETVTLLPGQYENDMKACYAKCSAFILPSFNEGSSIAALNALAYSKPAILTDGCNLTDSFTYDAAIKVDTNSTSIENGILKLINMTSFERDIIGKNGRKLAEEQYSWEAISRKILEVYHWISDKSNKPLPSSIINDF